MTRPIVFPPKAPEDVTDLPFAFARVLRRGESIVAAVAAAAPGSLAVQSVTVATPDVVVRVTGGLAETRYVLDCAAETSAGRDLVLTAILLVGAPGLDEALYATPVSMLPASVPGLVPPAPAVLAFASDMGGLAVACGAMGIYTLDVGTPAPATSFALAPNNTALGVASGALG